MPDEPKPESPYRSISLPSRPARLQWQILAALLIFLFFCLQLAPNAISFFRADADPAALTQPAVHPSINNMLAAFDPIVNRKLAAERHAHNCKVRLPTPDDIQQKRFDWQLSRYVMNYNLYHYLIEDYLPTLDRKPRVLDFGGTQVFEKMKGELNITKTTYPAVDIHRTSFPDGSFDIVAADQVLEHINFPHLAMLELHRLLTPKGIAIVTTCAYNPVHELSGFHDNWRFMVDGLKLLSMPYKGGIKLCGSWGTVRAITTRAVKGMSGGDYMPFQIMRDEEIVKNDLGNPFQTWLVVEK